MRGELNQTPAANRLHIGFFGKRNSGKSALLNALVGQDVVIVSDVAGTTTDPVRKNMEIPGLGPCTLTDTAGFDDEGLLGQQRVEKTMDALLGVDVAVMVFHDGDAVERNFYEDLEQKVPVVAVRSKMDEPGAEEQAAALAARLSEHLVLVSAETGAGIDRLREAIVQAVPKDFDAPSLTGGLVGPGDVVLLVMPQDPQAPQGRLILPQVQTMRDLLDKDALFIGCTLSGFPEAVAALSKLPALIITDSQAFQQVHRQKPAEVPLTSFSILMAAQKGNVATYVAGAQALDKLHSGSHVLIAEACSHAPIEEDIGRVKIPRMLRRRYGEGLSITVKSGRDYPDDLTPYDVIIQCGACMFNRRYVLARTARAVEQGVPITNYGIALAKLQNILDDVVIPS